MADPIQVPLPNKPTYAESRWTRAPIYIGEIPELGSPGEGIAGKYPVEPDYLKNISAQFQSPEDAQQRAFIQSGTPQDRGAIYVRPDDDLAKHQRLLRHEIVHNLLDMQDIDIAKVNQDPNVRQFTKPIKAALIKAGNMGDPDAEIPSYMAAFHADDIPGVLPSQRDAYVQAFAGALQKVNPTVADKFLRIANMAKRSGVDVLPKSSPPPATSARKQ